MFAVPQCIRPVFSDDIARRGCVNLNLNDVYARKVVFEMPMTVLFASFSALDTGECVGFKAIAKFENLTMHKS